MARKGKLGQKRQVVEILRPVRLKKYEQLLLIICEDENTEKYYFDSFAKLFPNETMFVKTVGTGLDPQGVAEKALTEKKTLEISSSKEIDFVWLVFDKDDASLNQTRINRFDRAFEIAKENNFKIAWSNEVFELWLLLHFININPNIQLPRSTIYTLLESTIKANQLFNTFSYKHGDELVIDIVFQIGNEEDAINRAKQLEVFHISNVPINSNPCTKIHNLIIELRDWITYWNYTIL